MLAPSWNKISTDQLFTKRDQSDLRWGDLTEIASSLDACPSALAGLWGYQDDEGIRLNGGRVGARYAPDFIRRFFYRLTPAPTQNMKTLTDWGNWGPGPSLESQLQTLPVQLCQRLESQPMITLGGGHDYGAVDGLGFLQWHQKQNLPSRPLIINFDAHLDVRPWQRGLNSGTPFSWLLDHAPMAFDFIEVGIQKHCSSPTHHQWLQERQGRIIPMDFVKKVGLLTALRQELAGTSKHQTCFISLDMDAFDQSIAPGCSQSWVGGLEYSEMVETLRWLFENKNVRLLGVYEVSPPLDVDHRTSKLAACLIEEFLRSLAKQSRSLK